MKMDNKKNLSKQPTTSKAAERKVSMSSEEEDRYVLPLKISHLYHLILFSLRNGMSVRNIHFC